MRVLSIVAFWIAAAAAVVAAGPIGLKIAAILLAALGYSKLAARDASVRQALLTGACWLILAVAAELTVTSLRGDGWFELLGSPSRPAVRDLLLMVWIGAPALFSTRP